jgi:hypothetical protein
MDPVTDAQSSHLESVPPAGVHLRIAEPIPPCPAWFAEFMDDFRATTIAEALAIEVEETGVAAKRESDPADTIRRLHQERPDILKRATRTSARLWENAVASPVELQAELPAEPKKPRRQHIPAPEVGPQTPLRLDVAARLAFPDGSMTASGLRREGRRGHLMIERIAGKDFTTIQHIEAMRLKCRDQQKAQDYGLNPKSVTPAASSPAVQHGSSATDRVRSARAALEKTTRKLKERSANTSPANTKSPATGTVIPLKS